MLIVVSYDLITFNKLRSKLFAMDTCKECKKPAEIYCNGFTCHTPYCRICYTKRAYCDVCKSNSVRPVNGNDCRITSTGYFVIMVGIILTLIGLLIDLSPIFSVKELIFLTKLTILIISFFPLSVGLKKLVNLFFYQINPLLTNT